MIHIKKGQPVPEHEDLRVLSVDGDYDDNDLIQCAHTDNPDFALCAFSASFVRYGGIINHFNDPEMLGKALLALDRACTHDAATLYKEEEARRLKRLGGDFTPENPVPVDEELSVVAQEAAEVEQQKQEEGVQKEESQESNLPPHVTTEAATPEEEAPAVDTTSMGDMSSTTPAVLDTILEATSTPAVPMEEASTTEEIVRIIKKKVAKKLLS